MPLLSPLAATKWFFTGERTGSIGSRDAARYQHPVFSFVSPYFIESQGSHFCIYILPHWCELLFFFLSRDTGISMDWSGGTGSVSIRTGYERYLPDNRTFLFCLHRLVHGGCVVPVRKSDRSSTPRVTKYSHQAWRRSTVGFFFLVLC